MKLSLGFSPCPNDTFIFDALVNKKIDTGDIEFDVCLEDVETLNEWALEGKLDITKLSFPAFFQSAEHYLLLHSGAALGKAVGPILVSAKPAAMSEEEVNQYTIVLPGEHTTAHLLFRYAYPNAYNKIFMRFDLVEDYILSNPDDTLGVIIHENRFTFSEKGLFAVKDLGEHWEQQVNGPVPLGGIAINQSVKRSIALRVNKLIQNSVELAFDKYPLIPSFVKEHAKSMNEDVLRKHINLYVNQYSVDLGKEGKEAIGKMYRVYNDLHDLEAESADLLFL